MNPVNAGRFIEVFEGLRSTTYCPFATRARIWYGPDWDLSCDFESNVQRIASNLTDFCGLHQVNQLHGYVINVVGDRSSRMATLSETATLFWKFLKYLSPLDPAQCSSFADIEHPQWQFEFANVRLFLNVFSGSYEHTHTKFIDLDSGIMIFAQPEGSFDLCGIDPSRPEVKQQIRDRFASNGLAYDGTLIDKRVESHLYVFPEQVGDDPVRFWLDR